MKKLVSLCCLVATFLLNPLWGCGGAFDTEFEFGEQEMTDYAEGTWSGHLAYPSGEETDFELVIERGSHDTRQQGLGAKEEYRTIRQPSCNDNIRHFVASAQACGGENKSVLPIQGRLTTADGTYVDQNVKGQLVVWGYQLTNGNFRLEIADGLELLADCDEQKTCDEGALLENPPEYGAWGELDASFTMAKQ